LEAGKCSCPDHELRKVKCKHLIAVSLVVAWDENGAVSSAVVKVTRRTYAQPNWAAYNRSQIEEKDRVEALLAGLCEGVVEPEYIFGRPGHLLRDEVFAVAHKVYTGWSGRRAQSDLRRCAQLGYLTHSLCPASLFNAFQSPLVGPALKAMIDESASVLADFERVFAPDSTGFSAVTYERYYDFKYGAGRKKADHALKDEVLPPPVERRDFVKLHAMVGTCTNVVAHAEVSNAGDAPTMKALLDGTVKNFDVAEVVADKGYLSKENVKLIHEAGAISYIPFKENSSGKGPLLWRQRYSEFMLHRPVFLQHYHARSNVESAFSAIKRVLGGSVRSKLPVAQANEVYAKVLCHNLRCVVEATFLFDLKTPTFGEVA
jgi:hypothetical protein